MCFLSFRKRYYTTSRENYQVLFFENAKKFSFPPYILICGREFGKGFYYTDLFLLSVAGLKFRKALLIGAVDESVAGADIVGNTAKNYLHFTSSYIILFV